MFAIGDACGWNFNRRPTKYLALSIDRQIESNLAFDKLVLGRVFGGLLAVLSF